MDNVRALLEKQKGLCVSIFMPMHRSGVEAQQDAIRLRNLLREAEQRLIANGLSSQKTKELVHPVQESLQDGVIFQHPSDGFALFLSSGVFRYYALPFLFSERVVVGNRFHIKPLLPLIGDGGRYYVLALSQNKVRLLLGTHHSVSVVHLMDVPENLKETLRLNDLGKALYLHTSAPAGMGKKGVTRTGYKVEAKENILRYFRQINEGLHGLLKNERAPLVLAGVEYLHPIYREVNTYPHLMEEGIAGNPERLNGGELHGSAWAIVAPYFLKAQQEAAAQYRDFAGTRQASRDINEIVPAAHRGRIKVLFVVVDIEQWGTFDRGTDTVHLHPKAEPGDEDLLDLAAIQTLSNEGTVYAMEQERMPDDAPNAAVFRY